MVSVKDLSPLIFAVGNCRPYCYLNSENVELWQADVKIGRPNGCHRNFDGVCFFERPDLVGLLGLADQDEILDIPPPSRSIQLELLRFLREEVDLNPSANGFVFKSACSCRYWAEGKLITQYLSARHDSRMFGVSYMGDDGNLQHVSLTPGDASGFFADSLSLTDFYKKTDG